MVVYNTFMDSFEEMRLKMWHLQAMEIWDILQEVHKMWQYETEIATIDGVTMMNLNSPIVILRQLIEILEKDHTETIKKLHSEKPLICWV